MFMIAAGRQSATRQVEYRMYALQGSVGFFHPFADSGGGGERVLW